MSERKRAELLAQVYADPSNDEPRLVYADWLQERDDPRGEFIALQIERAKSKAARSGARQREGELLDAHIKAWTKPLEPADAWVKGSDGSYGHRPDVEFRRGFPAVVRTRAINHHASWATVTHCNMPPHDDRCQVGALRAVTEATTDDIAALARLTKPLGIEELVWGLPHDPKRARSESPGVTYEPVVGDFSTIRVLPKLRRLELSAGVVGALPEPNELAWLWTAEPLAALEELMVPGWDLRGWIAVIAKTRLRRFDLIMPATNPYGWQAGTRIIVELDADRFATATALIYRSTASSLSELSRAFAELGRRSFRSVRIAIATKSEFDATKDQQGALAAVLRHLEIPAVIEKASRQ